MRRILFLTGTRADYGKIKSLMKKVDENDKFELNIFITGMHMLSKYGLTWKEIEKDGFKNIYKFINQQSISKMDITLSNTILGLSNYVQEMKPDLIVIHGDRLEALGGAIVGAFNNIKVAHIEGGEVSGTIDESIRHSITKLAHIHLVSNEEAKRRVLQLGEDEKSIFVVGSPDIDIMISKDLPNLDRVKARYNIKYDKYGICMFHPVTTEVNHLKTHVNELVTAMINSNRQYIVIYPNNDEGSEIILQEYKRLEGNNNFKIYPSIRFEFFLTLLKNCDFLIGNSSAGVREAGVYGIPSIDIGIRQMNRYIVGLNENILHVLRGEQEILNVINKVDTCHVTQTTIHGEGKSDNKFIEILEDDWIWDYKIQKNFIDVL